MNRLIFNYALIAMLLYSCQNESSTADLIVINANIWTADINNPKASALAVKKERIVEVGSDELVLKLKGKNTEVIDAEGKFITPGFIDTHVHLMTGGNSLLNVDLRDAGTKAEFIKRIADFASNLDSGQWILEGNWDHTLWGGELPRKDWIDEYTKNNPVVIYRLDGHMVLANALALRIAGIDENTADIEGGEMLKDKKGFLTGILKENAMDLMFRKIPPLSDEIKEKALKAAFRYLVSNGVTTVHDVDSLGVYDIERKLKDNNDLLVRIYEINPLKKWKQTIEMGNQDEWLKSGGLKGFVDGSLGTHTAAFNEPYSDKPNDSGYFINSEDSIYHWASKADSANLQVMIHAIGDRAIHTLLDIYERIIKENGGKDRRFRIEHAQHIAKEDIRRFAELGVIASMQPYHAIDDGRWAEKVIGSQRAKTTYAFKSLMENNALVAFGSDWPVAPPIPLLGIYAATTRRTLDGKNPDGWITEEKITVEQALVAYTRNAAYASFDENLKGILGKGKLADFVILSEDITAIKPENINGTKVMQTYISGKKVFDRSAKIN